MNETDFSVSGTMFRHVISGSLALASLNYTCRNLVPTFPQRSPPSLLTTAACGGLRSAPDCRPRRTFLHLSYSYAPPCGPALLVTQCQKQTFGNDGLLRCRSRFFDQCCHLLRVRKKDCVATRKFNDLRFGPLRHESLEV